VLIGGEMDQYLVLLLVGVIVLVVDVVLLLVGRFSRILMLIGMLWLFAIGLYYGLLALGIYGVSNISFNIVGAILLLIGCNMLRHCFGGIRRWLSVVRDHIANLYMVWAILLIVVLFIVFPIYLGIDIVSKGLDKSFVWLITQPFIYLGRDIWFAIGIILWILGTSLFLIEIYNLITKGEGSYTIGLSSIDIPIIDVILISTTIYGGALVAFEDIPIIPFFAWINPARALAPILGAIFGVPGALGVAIGSFIADALLGYLGISSIGGFIGSFLLAYTPYRFVKDKTFKTPRSFIEFYIWGVLISSTWYSIYISWWFDALEPIIGLPKPFIWGWLTPWTLFNNLFAIAIFTPILGLILYPIAEINSIGLNKHSSSPQEVSNINI